MARVAIMAGRAVLNVLIQLFLKISDRLRSQSRAGRERRHDKVLEVYYSTMALYQKDRTKLLV